ncbi:MAG: right-handed parallel beta-helix repeat-containing protein [Planctomycetes bacterium]|nr:right-handed parallel beta-helix repeat-containing protein [Planctomycetota bacterium]
MAARAGDIHVPADHATIQAALLAAADGDTIWVAPGVYFETIDFVGKDVALLSVAGPSNTVIDGLHAGSAVTFASGEGPGARLEGFQIHNGLAAGAGGGVFVVGSSPTIRKNVIFDNRATTFGGGIYLGDSSALVEHNKIEANTVISPAGAGGGIAIVGAGNARVHANGISANSARRGGGVFLLDSGVVSIAGNSMIYNACRCEGSAVDVLGASTATIERNVVYGSVAWLVPTGGQGPKLLFNTLIAKPSAMVPQGLVYADGDQTSAEVYGNILAVEGAQTGLIVGPSGGGVAPHIAWNDVWAPNGNRYGGAIGDQTGINGNLAVDPRFEAPSLNSYSLTRNSPLLDAGDPNYVPIGPSIDGEQRVLDGDLDGVQRVDFGAEEFTNVRVFAQLMGTGEVYVQAWGTDGLRHEIYLATQSVEFADAPFGTRYIDFAAPWRKLLHNQPIVPPPGHAPQTFYAQVLATNADGSAGNWSRRVEFQMPQMP